jgi:GNAT superfamily N-acetyltransferase
MERRLVKETDILNPEHKQIQSLLMTAFPETREFSRHSYLRSEPDFRILVTENNRVCAHISLSRRLGLVGSREIPIAGVGGLAVEPSHQRQGIALKLMEDFLTLAQSLKFEMAVGLAENPLSIKIMKRLGYVDSRTPFMFKDDSGQYTDLMERHKIFIHPLGLEPGEFSSLLQYMQDKGILFVDGQTF